MASKMRSVAAVGLAAAGMQRRLLPTAALVVAARRVPRAPAPRASARALHTTPAVRDKKPEAESKEVAEGGEPKPTLPARIWNKVKEEVQHYWHGTKLLAKEVSISTRLLRRMILGYHLTRREHRQLRRTMGDLLRLIPFIPFVIIPAAELLLPVAVKIFPNMLPSTFESKFAVEEKRRRLLKLRLDMAKFLQESIKEGGLQVSEEVKDSEAFKEFFRKVRTTGEEPTKEDVIKVAKLFDEEMTLDNLTRPQLVSICRYMQVNAFGTDNYMRFQIRHAMNRIRRDDLVISMEGTDSMSFQELLSACQSRGIWTQNMTEHQLRESLNVWIHLHFRNKISGTLMILSRAFYFVGNSPEKHVSYADMQIKGLEMTMSSLPESLLNEAELHFSKEAATNKQRLEVLEEQEHLIEDEAEQEQEHQAQRDADRKRKDAEKRRVSSESAEASRILPKSTPEAAGAKAGAKGAGDDVRMTQEQLSELGEALSILSQKSSVLRERQELSELMSSLPTDNAAEGTDGEAPAASGKVKALYKRIRAMLHKIDRQLEDYDRDVGGRMHLIQTSSTGKISADDLEQALRLIKHRPSEDKLQKLVDKLDVDLDGLVPLDHVLELTRDEAMEAGDGEELRDIQKEGQRILEGKKLRKSDIVEEN
ncbi:LETM1 domain-containing protein ylh47 [Malassezia obtusa]|uniref:Mitochondrial proton/calcium exchanger protein n=1 Tax=Malassezia obtusa TaxID=76774 RepID=A0AAF0DXH9_9BASI|nr:LETM1 domain-containing protein ylh47 [Malassezia obtusa]